MAVLFEYPTSSRIRKNLENKSRYLTIINIGRWRPRWSNRLEPGAVQIMDKVSITSSSAIVVPRGNWRWSGSGDLNKHRAIFLEGPADGDATGFETRGSFGMRVRFSGLPPFCKRGEYGWSQQSVKLPLLKLTMLVRIQPLAPLFHSPLFGLVVQ